MHPSTLPPELRLRRVRVTHRWREYGFELVVPRHESPGFRSIPGTFFVPPTTSQPPPAAMLWLSRLDTEGDRSCALRSGWQRIFSGKTAVTAYPTELITCGQTLEAKLAIVSAMVPPS